MNTRKVTKHFSSNATSNATGLFKSLCVALLLAATTHANIAVAAKPRVASLNLCADQLIMLLADPEQIASLSRISTEKAGSFYAVQAADYPQNNATAEDIVLKDPDIVIAGAFTVNYTPRLLQGLGVSVETLPLANSIQDAINNIAFVAELLEQQARGDKIIAKMQARLDAFPEADSDRPRAAIFGANGYTAGVDTLSGEALKIAGWANIATELDISAYGSLTIETLVRLWPDAVIEAPYANENYSRAQQKPMHPAIGKSGFNPKRITLQSNKTVCAGPWSVDVIDTLITARTELRAVN